MGKCLSRNPKKVHGQIMLEFEKQKNRKIEKKKAGLRKANTIGGKPYAEKFRLSRQETKNNFKMNDFVNKNMNNIIDEYR